LLIATKKNKEIYEMNMGFIWHYENNVYV